eukprot:3790417-Rhodomonas_salina.1
MGIEADSVVFICHGLSPALGRCPQCLASVSTAFTTKSTKMLLLRSLEAWQRHTRGQDRELS